jgi:hypothetical protein
VEAPVQKGKELRGYRYPDRQLVSVRVEEVDLGQSGIVDKAPPRGETSRSRPAVAGNQPPLPTPIPPLKVRREDAERVLESRETPAVASTGPRKLKRVTATPEVIRDMSEVYFRQRSERIRLDLEETRRALHLTTEKLLLHERSAEDHTQPSWKKKRDDLVATATLFEKRLRDLHANEESLREEARKVGAKPDWLRP